MVLKTRLVGSNGSTTNWVPVQSNKNAQNQSKWGIGSKSDFSPGSVFKTIYKIVNLI